MRFVVRLRGVPPDHELVRGGENVFRAAFVCGCEVLSQEAAGPAWPEQQADAEADSEADRDVLDAHEPNAPAGRLDEVEEHEEDDGETRLPGRERNRPRRVRGEQDRNRQHAPEHELVCADCDHECRADDESDGGSGKCAEDRPAGAQGIRA